MDRFIELINKIFITEKELEEIEEMSQVTRVEDNGISGRFLGRHWYTVIRGSMEYDVYI